jgi:hypothetical protein
MHHLHRFRPGVLARVARPHPAAIRRALTSALHAKEDTTMLAALLLSIFSHPELLTEGEALFNSIVHGEGGADKVAAVGNSLSQLAATASQVATTAKAAGACWRRVARSAPAPAAGIASAARRRGASLRVPASAGSVGAARAGKGGNHWASTIGSFSRARFSPAGISAISSRRARRVRRWGCSRARRARDARRARGRGLASPRALLRSLERQETSLERQETKMKHYEFLGLAIAGAAIWWWFTQRGGSVTVGTPSVSGGGIDTWTVPSAVNQQDQSMADLYGLYGF